MVKAEVTTLMNEGKTDDQVLDYYVAKFGGEQVLSEPRNHGTGRLVWIVPYVVGLGGAALALTLALRWSRRPTFAGSAGALADDPALSARLDDELRDLD